MSRRRHCTRLRSPASRCSPDRSRWGSVRTTPRRCARFPDRPAGWTHTPCRRADRDRKSTAGCAAPAPICRSAPSPDPRNPVRAIGAWTSRSSCTCDSVAFPRPCRQGKPSHSWLRASLCCEIVMYSIRQHHTPSLPPPEGGAAGCVSASSGGRCQRRRGRVGLWRFGDGDGRPCPATGPIPVTPDLAAAPVEAARRRRPHRRRTSEGAAR